MSLEAFTWPISCGGVLLIVYSLTLYPKLIKAVGAGNFARLGLVMAIPGALLMPTSSLLSPYALEQVSKSLSTTKPPSSYRELRFQRKYKQLVNLSRRTCASS